MFWLMKCEPDTYSIDDLKTQGKTQWEGVRNYQARNFMKNDMKMGDKVLFYHSNTEVPGVVGLAEVCRESYPDYFAFDESSKYFDPKSTKDNPRWFMVDVKFIQKFPQVVSLSTMKNSPELVGMPVLQKGQRLSIMPIERVHYDYVLSLAGV